MFKSQVVKQHNANDFYFLYQGTGTTEERKIWPIILGLLIRAILVQCLVPRPRNSTWLEELMNGLLIH